jgi:hypothetical protein
MRKGVTGGQNIAVYKTPDFSPIALHAIGLKEALCYTASDKPCILSFPKFASKYPTGSLNPKARFVGYGCAHLLVRWTKSMPAGSI